jgi:hypothetical protein
MILVTSATGNIGRPLIELFYSQGARKTASGNVLRMKNFVHSTAPLCHKNRRCFKMLKGSLRLYVVIHSGSAA